MGSVAGDEVGAVACWRCRRMESDGKKQVTYTILSAVAVLLGGTALTALLLFVVAKGFDGD